MNEDAPKPDLIALRVYTSFLEAEMAKMTLAGSGIDSMIASDDFGRMDLNLQFIQGVRLLIRPGDAERAKEILENTVNSQDDEHT